MFRCWCNYRGSFFLGYANKQVGWQHDQDMRNSIWNNAKTQLQILDCCGKKIHIWYPECKADSLQSTMAINNTKIHYGM